MKALYDNYEKINKSRESNQEQELKILPKLQSYVEGKTDQPNVTPF